MKDKQYYFRDDQLMCRGYLRPDLDMTNEVHLRAMWHIGCTSNNNASVFCQETVGDKITLILRVCVLLTLLN